MYSPEFLSQYITDVIKNLQYYILLDKNNSDMYFSTGKLCYRDIDLNKYKVSSKDEQIILDDLIRYASDIEQVEKILEIPLWNGKVIVKNVCGVNDDIRCISATNFQYNNINNATAKLIYKLETTEHEEEPSFKYKFQGEFTIKELLAAFMSVKFSKFDRWYEMFHSTEVRTNCDYLFIDLDFDHGS